MILKRALFPALVFSATVLLIGCSTTPAAPTANEPTHSASPTPTITPTPTPTAMTDAQAATLFHTQLCSANKSGLSFNEQWTSTNPNLAVLKKTAAVARDRTSAAAAVLDKALWPQDLTADIKVLTTAMFAQASTNGQIAVATSLDSAFNNKFAPSNTAGAASQRIRARLGLPADPFAGC